MKRKLIISGVGMAVSFFISLWTNTGKFNYDFMTAFGLINLILAVAGILVAGVMFLSQQKKNGKDLLAASGIVLLVGVAVCSAFPIKLGTM